MRVVKFIFSLLTTLLLVFLAAAFVLGWINSAPERYLATQNNLGVKYTKGEGVPQDYAEALRLYRLAANQGNAIAQFNIGIMYANGQGVPQDYAEALKWYRLAADQGLSNAQHNLGVMYANGQGVPQDYVSAYMWVNLAAAQGATNAANNRDMFAQRMSPNQIAEAQRLAREWQGRHPPK